MSFSDNLKRIRTDAGMTQKLLADKIGVTSVTIGNWERGIRQPSFELLPKLASTLNTSVDTLLGYSKADRKNLAEEEFLKKYRQLDIHGQKLVRIVCNAELDRMSAQTYNKAHTSRHNRHIPFYLTPPAAGVAAPIEGDEYEMLLVSDSVPAEADYAVRISGDSMEPYIKSGETVFVKETTELRSGDTGIFCVDGAMYCKQYYVDERRDLHLLSANPRRNNIHIGAKSGSSVRCCGKVLLDKAIPLLKNTHTKGDTTREK